MDFKVTKDTQFAVLGLGKFGRSFVRVLSKEGYHVLACDINPAVVHEVSLYADYVLEVDVTDESVIKQIGLENFDIVVVAFSEDFEGSVLTTMMAKESKVRFIVAKANGVRQKKILLNLGADYVVLPEIEIGERMAYHFIYNDPMEKINDSEKYSILEIKPKPNWVNKSIKDLSLREKEGINLLAIVRDDKVSAVLNPDIILQSSDILIILKINN